MQSFQTICVKRCVSLDMKDTKMPDPTPQQLAVAYTAVLDTKVNA